MAGESNLWIFTRCQNEINLDTVVCHISKEQKSTRKFISFSVVDTSSVEDDSVCCIKTLKKQEVPKHGKKNSLIFLETYSQDLDISEIKITIIDNGDRKYQVIIENSMYCLNNLYIKISKAFSINSILISSYQ